ncbi:hypothetical protein SRABI26_03583 [Arthrobacter sp. Bi26]|uniref:hypothetical protein n=1 Tax=Arthrobacter sp. Bi26 TaxID=2822350 RepID=UPI001D41309A|nr:hypothetical protein [Arthrobacter sp. Bi26]CAH0268100.1 hypothetical protein SRABI26_03583 [Arthrobacter sp. Bi26]
MSEIKSLAAPKASFDRRSVVKGAAWSVPVIAAAIAAPAAAASHHTGIVAMALGASDAMTYSGAKPKNGTAPIAFMISNSTHADVEGEATITVKITRAANTTGIRLVNFGGTPVTMPAYTSNAVSTTFSHKYKVKAGATETLSMGYSQDASGNSGTAGTYTMMLDAELSSPVLKSTGNQRTLTLTTLPKN